ncbi:LysR family transcriptional regulator [Paraflavitalea pollutisoli]|uniref:LysR family transcriptional regulator n=1 Tax=Paraflavitalea pollutisoli TaxID=3034143 RepID=UPI0023ED9E06|nr:LysR substrate-binding domain-containing protein [Paraflavitalea sp. H1-2-19X]
MELRQLKYFLKARELRNFTEAAQQLHISQSTLSQQIRQLEEELNIPLFNRVGKRIAITEAGEQFAEYARQSVKKAEDGLLMIRELNDLQTGTVTIGVAYGLRNFFTQALVQFAAKYPGIQVQVEYEASHDLYEKLARFELDFILAFHENTPAPLFTYQTLFSSPMVLVASRKSAIAKQSQVTLEEICQLPLVIATRGYSTAHIISKAFHKKKLNPRFSIAVNDVPTVLDLVKTSHWHSILVQTSVWDKDLVAIPIKDKSLVRTAKIITLKDAYEKKAVKAFQQLIKQINERGKT